MYTHTLAVMTDSEEKKGLMALSCIRQHRIFALEIPLWYFATMHGFLYHEIFTLRLLTRPNASKVASSENATHYR